MKYSDRMLPFILQKFEQNNEKNRIASMTVLKHLINSWNGNSKARATAYSLYAR